MKAVKPYCCTIGCTKEAIYVVRFGEGPYDWTDYCRSCVIADGWPAERIHLFGHQQSLAEMGRKP